MNLSNTDFVLLNNKTHNAAIYTTTDVSQNVMTFTFTNNTGGSLSLTGGTPVDGPATGGASSIVIDFSTILTAAEVAALTIADSGSAWSAKAFPGSPSKWALAPTSNLTLTNGQAVTFTIKGMACSGQTGGNFEVSYYNITGITNSSSPFQYLVAVRPTGSSFISSTSFTIVNKQQQQPIIYTTQDSSLNVMTFTFVNTTGAPLVLNGGTPVNSHVYEGGSSLVIDFSDILTNAEVAALTIKDGSNAWAAVLFPSSGQGTPSRWALAPTSNLTLAVNQKVEFTINNLTCTSQTPDNFEVSYYNINGYTDSMFPYAYHLAVLAPPVGSDLPIDIGFYNVIHPIGNQTGSFNNTDVNDSSTSSVVIPIPVDITYDNNYPIKNGYTVYLKNTSSQPLETSTSPIGAANVCVSFVFDQGNNDPNAITSQTNGNNIAIAIDPGQSSWSTIAHQQDSPNWNFKPLSNQIMFGNETVNLDVSNIITELLTTPNTISTVYIQFTNIPGYKDTLYTLEMLKQTAVASIPNGITATPTTVTMGQSVSLAWTTEVAYKVVLEYSDINGNNYKLDSTQGQIKLDETAFVPTPNPSLNPTVYNLTAYDNNQHVTAFASVTVNYLPATATLTASTQLVDILSTTNQTTLTWATTNAQKVTLNGTQVGLNSSQAFTINTTTVFTLVAYPYGQVQQPVTQTIVVYAYKHYPSIGVGAAGSGTTWQSLPLSLADNATNVEKIFVSNAAANNSEGQVFQVSQVSKATVGSAFNGNIMTLGPDNTKVYIAQTQVQPSSITCYDTSTGNQLGTSDIPAPPPFCIGVSPDNSILVSAQQNNLTAVSIFNLSNNGTTITYNKDITVGNTPQAIAFINGNIYIANYRDGTVSVINQSSLAVTSTITLNNSEPRQFLLIGNNLYVACEGGNQVSVINTTNNSVSNITVGNRPFNMVANQNNSLLFVCNYGTLNPGTVSVIKTSTNTVVNTINVGTYPVSARVSNSGSLLFVSNYCDRSVSVISLTNNTQTVIGSINLSQTNGNPVDIAAYNSINYYTDLFIATENFKNRPSSQCTTQMTDTTLQMSVLSIQELGGTSGMQEDAKDAPTARSISLNS